MFSLPIIGVPGLSGSEITKIRVSRPGAAPSHIPLSIFPVQKNTLRRLRQGVSRVFYVFLQNLSKQSDCIPACQKENCIRASLDSCSSARRRSCRFFSAGDRAASSWIFRIFSLYWTDPPLRTG